MLPKKRRPPLPQADRVVLPLVGDRRTRSRSRAGPGCWPAKAPVPLFHSEGSPFSRVPLTFRSPPDLGTVERHGEAGVSNVSAIEPAVDLGLPEESGLPPRSGPFPKLKFVVPGRRTSHSGIALERNARCGSQLNGFERRRPPWREPATGDQGADRFWRTSRSCESPSSHIL